MQFFVSSERKPPRVPAKAGYAVADLTSARIGANISRSAIERLEAAMDEAEGLNEVGGLLLGRAIRDDAGDWQSFVEEFEPVASDYDRAPLYTLLSERERKRLKRALRAYRKRDRVVVGWYRTHARKGIYLSQHDYSIISESFPQPFNIFLVIRRDGLDATGGLFAWQDGDIRRESPHARIALRGRRAANEIEAEPQPLIAAAEKQLATLVRSDRDPSMPRTKAAAQLRAIAFHVPPLNPVRVAPWLIATVLAAALIWTSVRFHQTTSGVQPRALGLGLTIAPGGSTIRVRWNRQSPIVQHAREAALIIRDGQVNRRIELDHEQLTSGSLVYALTAPSPAVSFRLEVGDDKRRTIAESIEAIVPGAAGIEAAKPPAVSVAPAAQPAPEQRAMAKRRRHNTGTADRSGMGQRAYAPQSKAVAATEPIVLDAPPPLNPLAQAKPALPNTPPTLAPPEAKRSKLHRVFGGMKKIVPGLH